MVMMGRIVDGFLMPNDVTISSKIANPLFFCHPVRDRLT
jgi:hypothetical protein